MTPEMERLVEGLSNRYFGKYRGEVVGTEDPTSRGRLEVRCPSVMGDQNLWAMPCTPYAGDQIGFFALPPPGTSVWLEFEAGDLSKPIWAGCFWKDGEIPSGDASESVVFLRTPGATLRIDNDAGEIEIETSGGTKVTLKGDSIKLEGPEIEQSANGASVKLSASGFDAMNGALSVV